MANKRFLSKTSKHSITTTPAVVVMLLLLLTIACNSEKKEIVEVAFDPEKTYTMRATEVNTLISDSGLTRYRVNAKEWLVYGKAKDPYWYFPEGVYVEKFDTLFQPEANVEADTAYYFSKRELWRLVGHVEVQNLEGEKFETSELFWNSKEDRVYSDKYIRIEQEDKIITGIGFESNQKMTQYKIFNSQGTFPVSDSSSPSATTAADSIAVTDSVRTL